MKTRRKKLKLSSCNILDIPDELLREIISKYLTIYENYQLLFVFKNIEIDWCYLQNRDFYTSAYPLSKYNAIHLDNGNLFTIIDVNLLITKTNTMKIYCLSSKELEIIEPKRIERNPKGFETRMKLYDIRQVRNLAASKHRGLTNLKLKRILYSKKRETETLDIWLDKKEIKNKQFNITMTCKQRQELLDVEFSKPKYRGRVNRTEYCKLCNEFISGEMLTKSVEEIVSIIAFRTIIFEIDDNQFSRYFGAQLDQIIDDRLQEMKFKNDDLCWIDCVYKIRLYE